MKATYKPVAGERTPGRVRRGRGRRARVAARRGRSRTRGRPPTRFCRACPYSAPIFGRLPSTVCASFDPVQVAEHAVSDAACDLAPDRQRSATAPVSPRAARPAKAPERAAAAAAAAPGGGGDDDAAAERDAAPKAAASEAGGAAGGKLPATKEGKVLHPDLLNPAILRTQWAPAGRPFPLPSPTPRGRPCRTARRRRRRRRAPPPLPTRAAGASGLARPPPPPRPEAGKGRGLGGQTARPLARRPRGRPPGRTARHSTSAPRGRRAPLPFLTPSLRRNLRSAGTRCAGGYTSAPRRCGARGATSRSQTVGRAAWRL
jgi:hypothetical protein